MEWIINEKHTLYGIFLTLQNDCEIKIGALGNLTFEHGNYVYIGSAKKNIKHRVLRHYKLDKPKRWHLDYLRPYCQVTKIQTFDHKNGECSLAKLFSSQGVVIKKFGSSDCRCDGHLIRLSI